ncbi:MAG TPA: DUF3305 domain-containing protein [Xanthobacteraceae bacterium]|jgi:hypothetical protein
MSRAEPFARLPVGVVIERRKATSAWADFIWRPIAVLPGVPDAEPWTALDGDDERKNFYAGASAIELYRSATSGYRDNLASGAALLWIVLRPTDREPPFEVAAVTAEPSEGEAFSESAANLVDSVPMPESIQATIAEFVAAHHVEHPFVKRERTRTDPEAMARRTPAKDRR